MRVPSLILNIICTSPTSEPKTSLWTSHLDHKACSPAVLDMPVVFSV